MSGGGTASGRRNNVSTKANTATASEAYKEFADMSVTSSGLAGFSYGEDAAETVKWFEENSNFRSVIAEMSMMKQHLSNFPEDTSCMASNIKVFLR